MELKRQYIVNESNQKVAVLLDIDTFEKIESVLEDYALAQLMEAEDADAMNIEDAKRFYAGLDKA